MLQRAPRDPLGSARGDPPLLALGELWVDTKVDPPPLDDPGRPNDETKKTKRTKRPHRPDFDQSFLTFGILQTPFWDHFWKVFETTNRDQRGLNEGTNFGRSLEKFETLATPQIRKTQTTKSLNSMTLTMDSLCPHRSQSKT